MTPRERWLALLARKTPDRIPTDYQATDEVTERLRRDLGCADNESLYRKLDIDARRMVEPVWRRPPELRPPRPTCGASSIARFRTARAPTWSRRCCRWPAPRAWPRFTPIAGRRAMSSTTRPSPGRSSRTTAIGRSTAAVTSRFCCTAICVAWKRRWRTWRCGRRWPTPFWATFSTSTGASPPHLRGRPRQDRLTYVAEDLGSQTGPLMSLAMYRRFLLPNQIKMAELARSFGVHVMYHTDGAARAFLPDLIDRVGIEILNPIQWRAAGMEREKLVADFGRRIIFHGSIDNQQTLPFGTVDDVIREVRESVEIYRRARWICAPCHNLQPVSPTANIVAMYQAIGELGRL